MLINGRLLSILLLGFASGLPIALVGSTLQAWYTESHISLMTIGVLTLIGLPYVLKFLWAPFMDYFRLPFLGKRRGWIAITQIGLALLLFFLATMNPVTQAIQMGCIALFIAFFSATQDVAIDAYRTEILLVEERGIGSAYYMFAWRMAALCSGGLGLIIADHLGFQIMYEIMGVLMLSMLIVTYFSKSPFEINEASSNFVTSIVKPFSALLQRDKIILLIFFVVFYKLGDALALSLMSNFLLHGLGFSLTEIGIAYKTVSIAASILGAFIGGLILMRRSLYFSLLLFGFAQAFSTLLFALLALSGKDYLLMISSIFIENFCSGMSTAAFLAFLMSLCERRYTATQFASLSAVASLGRVFLGPFAALLVNHFGWVEFYIWSFVLSLPGILFLFLLKDRVFYYAELAPQ